MREYGQELGLLDPFEREPGSRPYTPGSQREALVSVPKSRRPRRVNLGSNSPRRSCHSPRGSHAPE
ncbi:MAG: hypothetical protein JO166_16460 [Deltaproteobacteria bacterium]|nr:hypothetical protein [Deltaproteobacteria bacterium]